MVSRNVIKLTATAFDQLKVDGFQFLKGVSKIVASAATANLFSIPAATIDTITAIKTEDQVGSIAWKLITRSLANAVIALIVESDRDVVEAEIETYGLDQSFNELLSQKGL